MKRSIKVILVLLGVVAIIAGAHFLEDYLNSDPGAGRGALTPYKALSLKIENSWGQKNGWDSGLYTSLINEVDDNAQMDNISKRQRKLLIEAVNYQALSVLEHAFDSLLSSSGCNHDLVVRNNEGVETINDFKDLRGDGKNLFSGDSRVVELQSMYNAYEATRNFALRSFAVTAETDGADWKAFRPNYKSGWDKKRSECENGKYFQSHFSKIDVIKNGWNAYAGKVADSEKSYYKSIAKSIRSYIKTQSRTLKSDYNAITTKKVKLKNEYRKVLSDIEDNEKKIDEVIYSSQAVMKHRLDELKQEKTKIEKELSELKNDVSSLVSAYKTFQRQCVDIQSKLSAETSSLNLSEVTTTDEELASVIITSRNEVKELERILNEVSL